MSVASHSRRNHAGDAASGARSDASRHRTHESMEERERSARSGSNTTRVRCLTHRDQLSRQMQ